MYTCESASQLFVQLLKLIDDHGDKLKNVGYDRACEFQPFVERREILVQLSSANSNIW